MTFTWVALFVMLMCFYANARVAWHTILWMNNLRRQDAVAAAFYMVWLCLAVVTLFSLP